MNKKIPHLIRNEIWEGLEIGEGLEDPELLAGLAPGEEEEVGGGAVVVLPLEQLFCLHLPAQPVVLRHHTHHLLLQHGCPVPGINYAILRSFNP